MTNVSPPLPPVPQPPDSPEPPMPEPIQPIPGPEPSPPIPEPTPPVPQPLPEPIQPIPQVEATASDDATEQAIHDADMVNGERPVVPGRTVEVTFRVDARDDLVSVAVAGDFNDWSINTHLLERGPDGFTIAVPLSAGQVHRYRYFVNGVQWENDWRADSYVPNPYGGDDSVVDLTHR